MDPTKPSPMFRAIVLAGVALTSCGGTAASGGDGSDNGDDASADGSTTDAASSKDASGDVIAPADDAGLDAASDTGDPSDARDDFPLIR